MTTHDVSPKPSLSDRQAAGLYEAMSLRYYRRYLEFLHSAEVHGAPVPKVSPDDMATAADRYDEIVQEWVSEPPSGPSAVAALLDFPTLISVEIIADATMIDVAINTEVDAVHQAAALHGAARWINDHVALPEYTKKMRARLAAKGIEVPS
jgi:hypothetical protein